MRVQHITAIDVQLSVCKHVGSDLTSTASEAGRIEHARALRANMLGVVLREDKAVTERIVRLCPILPSISIDDRLRSVLA